MTEIIFLADESCDFLIVRKLLGEEIILLIADHGIELKNSFVVLEPGRARLRKI